MDANLEMLNFIYQNAQMGQDTLTQLMDIAKQDDFRAMLTKQRDEYKAIFDACDKHINQRNAQPDGIGKMAELSAYLMINMKTMTDKTPSHIAGMIMQGSVMGIIDITRNLKKYSETEPAIVALGQRLLTLEEHNVEECKKFL